jgi:hypothetical protein
MSEKQEDIQLDLQEDNLQVKIAKEKAGSYAASRKIKDWTL